MASPIQELKSSIVLDKYANRLYSTLNEMRQNGVSTDVVLECNDKKFPAHQMIITAGSPYIKKMLESQFKESTTRRIDFSYVKEETLNVLLDFLYLKPTKLWDKSLEDLMEIHDMSHLFEMEELSDMCWTEMKKHINLENFVDIWNKRSLYTNKYSVEEILTFLIKNLRLIFKSESVLELNESQMSLLMEKIREKPTEVYMLEGILKWIKRDDSKPNKRLDVFYCLNFEKIAREHVEEMMVKEAALFDSSIIKSYLEIQVIPSLKSNTMVSNYDQPKYDFIPFKYFCFGYQFEIKNNKITKQNDTLKIIDVMNEQNKKHQLKSLPFKIKEGLLCFCSYSRIYFVKELSSSSKMLQIYDWETNTVLRQVHIPGKFELINACTVGNKIYLIGNPEGSRGEEQIVAHCITPSSDYCNMVKLSVPSSFQVISSVNLKGKLHVLCKRFGEKNGSGYSSYRSETKDCKSSEYEIFALVENDLKKTDFSRFAIEENLVENELVTECGGKCYVFLLSSKRLYCFVYDPNHEHWNRFDLGDWRVDLGEPMKCCGTNGQALVIGTRNGGIVFFNCMKNEITHCAINVYDHDKKDNFITLGNNKDFDFVLA